MSACKHIQNSILLFHCPLFTSANHFSTKVRDCIFYSVLEKKNACLIAIVRWKKSTILHLTHFFSLLKTRTANSHFFIRWKSLTQVFNLKFYFEKSDRYDYLLKSNKHVNNNVIKHNISIFKVKCLEED